jgi:hypothetical protein
MGSAPTLLFFDWCANCGKQSSYLMGSSEWGHSRRCCSKACGVRYGQKIRSGMVIEKDWPDDNRLALRIRIKQLSHRLKGMTR